LRVDGAPVAADADGGQLAGHVVALPLELVDQSGDLAGEPDLAAELFEVDRLLDGGVRLEPRDGDERDGGDHQHGGELRAYPPVLYA